MEKRTESEMIADLESAKTHRELAEEPLLKNNPVGDHVRRWHLEEAERLENE